MSTRHATLFIYMNSQFVGELRQTATNDMQLEYAAEWLNSPYARPVSISLPLSQSRHSGVLVRNFFDNLLPDSSDVRRRLQARLRASSSDPFDLLYHLGRDCIGAIQLLTDRAATEAKPVKPKPLSNKEIADELKGLQLRPLGIDREKDFRISLAGMQDKTAFTKINGRWCRPTGTMPTTHIFKIAMRPHPEANLENSIENEWLCAQIIAEFGLPAVPAEMLNFDGVPALALTRFDRQLGKDPDDIIRIPQEDMCQALGISPGLKYESDGGPGIQHIMHFLLGSNEALEDRSNFLKVQIIFFLLAATDGHAKNFSIFIRPGGRYVLTPFYDVMSAHAFVNDRFPVQKLKMAMAYEAKNRHYHWDKIYRRHLLGTAQACGISEDVANRLIEEVIEKTPAVIRSMQKKLPATFPERIASAIFEGMLKAREIFSI